MYFYSDESERYEKAYLAQQISLSENESLTYDEALEWLMDCWEAVFGKPYGGTMV